MHSNSFLNIHQNFAATLAYTLGPISGLICYVGECAKTNNTFVKFHALQSTIFFAAVMTLQFILRLLPFTGFLEAIIDMASFAIWVYLMVSAFKGKEFRIPIIGDVCWERINR